MNIKKGAVVDGIKRIGIGKQGSKSCSTELVNDMVAELKDQEVEPLTRAALHVSLFIKGVAETEQQLLEVIPAASLQSSEALLDALAPDLAEDLAPLVRRVLALEVLSREEARVVGEFLFDRSFPDTKTDVARVIFAVALRMKHTEAAEYAGLLDAMHGVIKSSFAQDAATSSIVQFAEPFDGTARSYMLSPVLAHYVQSAGFTPLHLTGRCSGPKFGMTAQELLRALDVPAMTEIAGLETADSPPCGWQVEQMQLSPSFDDWVDIRRMIVKRPFMATLEKLLNPWNSRVIVSSAFHLNYAEKMVDTFELMGWNAMLAFFKTTEGGIGLSPEREGRCLATRRLSSGEYERKLFSFEAKDFDIEAPAAAKDLTPAASDNASLIQQFIAEGGTADAHYNARCNFSLAAFKAAFGWVLNGKEL